MKGKHIVFYGFVLEAQNDQLPRNSIRLSAHITLLQTNKKQQPVVHLSYSIHMGVTLPAPFLFMINV